MAQDVKIIDVDSDGILTVVFPTGVERAKSSFNLIQRVAKRILTLEGSDIVNPTVGTNIPAMFTSLADSDKEHVDHFSACQHTDTKHDGRNNKYSDREHLA